MAELIALFNREVLFDLRKTYGMYGQIHWHVVDLGPIHIHVEVWTVRPVEPMRVVRDIHGTIRQALGSLLPVPEFRATFRAGGEDGPATTFRIPFTAKHEEGMVVLVPEVVERHQARHASRVWRLWREVNDECASP